MTTSWIQYLQQTGAQIDNNIALHFGHPDQEQQQALSGDIIADLSYLGLIQISGSEAEKFLQGQLTNDVRQVTTEQSQLSAWCSPKGRILVNFRLFQRDNAYYLLLPQDSLEATLKRLQMYVLRADVKLEAASDRLPCVGIAGANSTQILTNCLGKAPPTEVNASVTIDQSTIICLPGRQPRYLILSETLPDFWQCATQSALPTGAAAWQLLEILAGLPQVVPATADEFVPQMVNYQALGGINFKKGCYTGQEVVARMQYLGSLKRRMYLVQIDTPTPPQPGDSLYVKTSEQSVGKIVNASLHPEGGTIALAVIQINHAENDEIHLHNPQGNRLQLLSLPYSLPAT